MHFSGKEKRAQRLDSLLFTGGPILIHALRMERDKDILEMLGYISDSRTRVGCDPNHPRLTRALLVSIRAPAKGATFSREAGVTAGSIFRFAHLWEVRHCC